MARSSDLGHAYNTRFCFTFDKIQVHRFAMKTLVQAVSLRRCLSEETWVRPQASPFICGRQQSNETGFLSCTFGIPSQHHCTSAPYTYSFMYLRPYVIFAK